MTLDVDPQRPYSPRPLRSLKQSIDRLDPDCAPANEHRWTQPPASLPTPSPTYDRLSEVSRSSSAPSHYSISRPSNRQSRAQQQPKSVRLRKRALEDSDSACEPATKRHHHLLLSPSSSSAPSRVDDGLSEVLRPASRPSNASINALSQLKSVKPLKRALEDGDIDCTPTRKRHRLESPTFLPSPSSIGEWLSTIPRTSSPPSTRPRSAPAQFSAREALTTIDKYQPASLAIIQQMSQSQGQSLKRGSNASSQNLRPSTSHPIYRSLLFNNGIRMDHTKRRMPTKVREMMDKQILQGRSSPPLSEERVLQVITKAEALADSAEGKVSSLITTDMFPVDRSDVEEGGNTMWSTDALPYNPDYDQPLAAPKPDFHYGYPPGQRSDWTAQENAIADHRVARPYTQPARGNRFPFLALEMKSEATGGTLWHAENQAAGSGSYCVKALQWLLEQASPTEIVSITDCVAFTGAVTHREVIFHVHYYSEEDAYCYMSYLKRFSTTDPRDVQGCHDLVKNILEYGLTTRQTKIKNALAQLFPVPDQWKQTRPASSVSTPATSFSGEPRPSKNARNS
ncbi:MAG: hypothetical protein Q9204_005559 [Flavoplaca sp. TL-2023a]